VPGETADGRAANAVSITEVLQVAPATANPQLRQARQTVEERESAATSREQGRAVSVICV